MKGGSTSNLTPPHKQLPRIGLLMPKNNTRFTWRPNEKEISRGRVLWQTPSQLSGQGRVSFIDWLCGFPLDRDRARI